ncbi:SHOCT domain-containing protein [Geobacter sp.]|uniref:SHOCT domain-containing protein n=1 Tax=Geobacter sp. TaxID=46610 RepID=UPI00260664C7|nr:SHOCT domain-containing protein [Geobacter sp.]
MKTRLSRTLLGVVGGLLLAGMGLGGAVSVSAAERRPVWERQDQFVALEKQDVSDAPNEHPARLSSQVLRQTLGALQVRLEGGQPVPLFTEGELDVLGPELQKALELATPDDDVTFAMMGLHPTLLGFVKKPLLTTGRIFFRQEKLNLILGQVHEPVRESDDRRLHPFVPGSRKPAPHPAWRVTTKGGELAQVDDRSDWLALSLLPAEQVMSPPETGTNREAKPALAPRTSPPRPVGRSVEERLILLNDLKQKGLITEEEYRAKRLKILDEL